MLAGRTRRGARDPDARTNLRAYIEEVVAECERVLQSSVTATIARLVEFRCQVCSRETLANAASAERRGGVQCLHPGCQAEHSVTRQDGDLYFRLTGTMFECQSCGHHMLVATRQLAADYEFACEKCSRRHKLVDKVWRYAAAAEPPSESR